MDIFHYWNGDISGNASGDLKTVDGVTLGIQRVLRRLMTAQGEYVWHPTYGAGIPQRIGETRDDRVISAIVMSQIFLEPAVSKTPIPVITVTPILNGVFVSIQYVDAYVQKVVKVRFPIYAAPVTTSQQQNVSLEVPA